MVDCEDMRYLQVFKDEDGTYRACVMEIDPLSEASSIEFVVEGTLLDAIADELEVLECKDVPVFLRYSNRVNNPGEFISADGSRVLEEPRSTLLETLKRAVEVADNPPEGFEDRKPHIKPTELLHLVFAGQVGIDNMRLTGSDEWVRMKWNDNNEGVTILVRNPDCGWEWRFSVDNGEFTRLT